MKQLDRELKKIIESIKRYIELEKLSGINDISFVEYRASSKEEKLELLKKKVSKCRRCPLYKSRINTVFGSGSINARLLFIGEAPGRDEDLQGLPFVGRAGELLTRIIESIGLKRKDVYITNVVKCRPPDNRNPLPTEILECIGYLTEQIELIQPEIICALGKVAAKALLKTEESISRIRGKFQKFNGIKIIPTFHPAYLLRNPNDKRLVWDDLKKIRKELFKF